ncbi:MAG TPA: type VI secretion system tip protein TssI/VgrG, partial [Gemmatimonadaceae bacterium]
HAIRGQAKSAGLVSGMKLEVADYYRRDVNKQYVITSVDHVGVNASYRAGEDTAFEYDAGFVAIPAVVPYRPPRVTPKAIVRGVQTAVVVGPSGEEIYVDKYARVKVQFFWDQVGKKNEQSSCWVRVSSTWAGKQWGAIQIPRIGQEVIVDFLEGDPDRPIITGRVYNAEQMPPYELPANGTQSGVKTRSATKGEPANFNELRFEDKKGSEQFFMHAEKNMDTEVEKDETHWVGQNRTLTVDKDETILIKNNRTETVDKDETITIKGNRTETVEKDETYAVKGKRTTTVDKDEALTISQGARKVVLSQGNDSLAVKMGNLDTKVDMGNVTLKAGLGKIAYEAMQELELKVGQSSIKVDQTGVTIKGMMIKIEGQIQTEVKGMMATISGDAMLTVKGGITMIN